MWTIVRGGSVKYVFKNVNISNDARVSKKHAKSFSSQYVLNGCKIDVFNTFYLN